MDPPDFINEDSFSAHSPRQESTAPLGMPGQSQGPAAQQQSPAEAAATAGHGAWPASPMRAASGWLATPKSMKAPLTPPSRMLPGVAAPMPFQPMQPVFFGPVVLAPLPLHGLEWGQPGLAGPAPAAAPGDAGGQGRAAALMPRFERLPLHSQVRSLSGPGSLAQPPLGPTASEQQRRARAVENVRQLLQRSGGAYPPGQGGLAAPPVPPQSPPLGTPAGGALSAAGSLLAQDPGAVHSLQAPPMPAAGGLGAPQPPMVHTKPAREGQGAFGSPLSLLSKAPTSPTTIASAAGTQDQQQQQQQQQLVQEEQQVEQQAESSGEGAGERRQGLQAGVQDEPDLEQREQQHEAVPGRQGRQREAAAGEEQVGRVGGEGAPGLAASEKPAGTRIKAADAKVNEPPAAQQQQQQQQRTGPGGQRPAHKAGPRPKEEAASAAAAAAQQRARSPQLSEPAQPALELHITSPVPAPRGRSRRRQASRKRQRRRSPTSSQGPLPQQEQPVSQPAAQLTAEASGNMGQNPAGTKVKVEAVEAEAGPAVGAAKTVKAAAAAATAAPDPPAAAGPAATAATAEGPGEAGAALAEGRSSPAAAADVEGTAGAGAGSGAGLAAREGHHDPEGLGLLEAACWVERQDSNSNAVAPIWSSAGSRARAGPGPFKATFGAALLGSPLGMLMAPAPSQQPQQQPGAGASSGGRDSEQTQPEGGDAGEVGPSKGYSMRSERYKGVYRMPTGRWRAQFTHKNRVIQLGMFDNDEQAARAWDKAAIQYRGASTKTNLPVDKATAEAWAAEPIPGPKNGEEPPPRKRPSQGAQLKQQKQKQHTQKPQEPRQQEQKKRRRAASPSVWSEATPPQPKRQRPASPSVRSGAALPQPKRQRSSSTAGGRNSRKSMRSADTADVSTGPSRQHSLTASLPKAVALAGRMGTGAGGGQAVSGRPPRPPSAAGERKERQQRPAAAMGAGSAERAAPKGRPPSRSRKKASRQAATDSETVAPLQPPRAAAAGAVPAAGAGEPGERQQSSSKSGGSRVAEARAGKQSASRNRKRKAGPKPAVAAAAAAAELERQGSQGTAGPGDEGAAA